MLTLPALKSLEFSTPTCLWQPSMKAWRRDRHSMFAYVAIGMIAVLA